MKPELDALAWARSGIVAVAIVVAALVQANSGPDAPEAREAASPSRAERAKQPVRRAQPPTRVGNRRVCLSLRGKPMAVLERQYPAIWADHNASGDTSVPMRGGSCWIKWSYGPGSDHRLGKAERVRWFPS